MFMSRYLASEILAHHVSLRECKDGGILVEDELLASRDVVSTLYLSGGGVGLAAECGAIRCIRVKY